MTEAQKENQKEIIISDLIELFKRQSENWGDQFGRILEVLLRAHLDLNIYHGESNSLMDVFRCVINQDRLTELIDRTGDTVVREQLVRVREGYVELPIGTASTPAERLRDELDRTEDRLLETVRSQLP